MVYQNMFQIFKYIDSEIKYCFIVPYVCSKALYMFIDSSVYTKKSNTLNYTSFVNMQLFMIYAWIFFKLDDLSKF